MPEWLLHQWPGVSTVIQCAASCGQSRCVPQWVLHQWGILFSTSPNRTSCRTQVGSVPERIFYEWPLLPSGALCSFRAWSIESVGQSRCLPKRVSYERCVLCADVERATCSPETRCLPHWLFHQWSILSRSSRRSRSCFSENWAMSKWIRHQWRLLFSALSLDSGCAGPIPYDVGAQSDITTARATATQIGGIF